MEGFTSDGFFNGELKIFQAPDGYRFSIDAVLLAAHVRPRPNDRIVDLGCGCGIMSLLLARRHPEAHIIGVEIQSALARIACLNVTENRMQDRIRILEQDMRHLSLEAIGGPADIVISNPPFHKPDSGRINPNAQRAMARHEILVNLKQVLSTAGSILKTGGKFILIYPVERLAEVVSELREKRLEPKYIRMIHSKADKDAKLMIVASVKCGKPGLKIGPMLSVYADEGGYSQEVAQMMRP